MRRSALLLSLVLLTACSASVPGGSGMTSSSSRPEIPKGWQPFSDETIDVSIALPRGWTRETEASTPTFRGGTPPVVLSVLLLDGQFATLAEALAARDAQTATAYEGQPSLKVLSSADRTINGQSTIERREELLAAGFTVVTTYFLHQGQLYAFTTRPDADEALSTEQITVHQQAMETVLWR